jgi:hypothetical protein
MPIPSTALDLGTIEPVDLLDFYIAISQGPLEGDVLQAGEEVASYTLALPLEASAAGLTIVEKETENGKYATRLADRTLAFWLNINPTQQKSTAFDGQGVTLPIELTITTTNTPPRIKQRTLKIRVTNK